jgi:glycosyltransferase involved in cell wall biosynthesis
LDKFWCDKPLTERKKRVVYVARFVSVKRHEILKRLAADLPDFEFVSVGGLIDAEKAWFNKFQENLPSNYTLKTNLPEPELLNILRNSRIYVHLMEGEHFGIAPIEGLASGCVTLVHNSGGMQEFIPEEYRWDNYDDLKQKIVRNMDAYASWEIKCKELWGKISILSPEVFQKGIWSQVEKLVE